MSSAQSSGPRPLLYLLSLWLATSLLSTYTIHVRAQSSSTTFEPCSLCYGNATYNPTALLSDSGLTCGAIGNVIGATPANDPSCFQVQLEAYVYCDCPFPEAHFCSMCDNAFFRLPEPNKKLSVGSQTCQDVLFAPIAETAECQRIATSAFDCGCPNVTQPPPCSTCLNRTLVDTNKLLPPNFTTTCADFTNSATMNALARVNTTTAVDTNFTSVDSTEQNNSISIISTTSSASLAEEECDNIYTGSVVDVVAYCGGCVDATSPIVSMGTCQLCDNDRSGLQFLPSTNEDVMIELSPYGTFAGAINLTCRDINDLATFVTDSSYCQYLMQTAANKCCAATPTPSKPTSMSPTMTSLLIIAQRNTLSPAPSELPTSQNRPAAVTQGTVSRGTAKSVLLQTMAMTLTFPVMLLWF